jgi:ribonuclease HII
MADLDPRKVAEYKARAEELIRERSPDYLIGVDEVGYGPIAGPVVIGAVGVPVDWTPPTGLTDSKNLSRRQIITLAGAFYDEVLSRGIGIKYALFWGDSEEIDRDGLGKVRKGLLQSGVEYIRSTYLETEPFTTLAIVDGNLNIPNAVSIPKADLVCPVVSMAAVLAKCARDTWMINVAAKKYPGYGFEESVGYDTLEHRKAIKALGPCPIHRMSTRTLKERDVWSQLPNLGRGGKS